MRIDFSPAFQQFVSMATLGLALGAFGWVAWTAVDTWTSDPYLNQIQQIRESQ
ncbi:hypothetical protein GFS31_07920 [Leptolyngbya sp. BL0902]|uniref:hypothetical protein n=1 Tax=Leptolyngbya sp. BL0902 TaxID=1115757 RepID=UPI0018E90545|nr:hypothetical protein [Leptolyngbya sp. BL0902]QQE64114.1 hypothetical protein GFS31_07920 [Leptolyngbya sp. BL0902]